MKSVLFPLLLLASFYVTAQVPRKINYQAVIRNNAGTVTANQDVSIRFSLHDGTPNGNVQYSETHTTTTNAFGLINLQIGDGTVISGDMDAVTWHTGSKFLQVEADITGGNNFTGLATVELISVPYALQTANAQNFSGTLDGDVTGTQKSTVIGPNAITSPKIANDAVTNAKIADNAVNTTQIAHNAVTGVKIANDAVTNTKIADNAVNTTQIADNAVTGVKIANDAVTNTKIADNAVTAAKISAGQVVKNINGIEDNVTIATTGDITLTTSGNTLTIGSNGVAGITTGTGLSSSTTNGNVTISASLGGDGSASTLSRSDHTHIGANWSSAANNILSLHSSSATGRPLYVTTTATNVNSAVLGSVTAANGSSTGLWGRTSSTNGQSAGVFGQAVSSGGAKAVWGDAAGNGTYAIFGQANGTGAMAGYFLGNVTVTGNLSKGGGSFKIDHPLDPANKYLSHSFVESPDMMNVYNGNVTLNANGEATVQLPDWFEALNRDFRYQLTAIGKPMPNLYIAREVSGNTFRIAGGTPGSKVSWMLTGIRHDPYANKHRIPVEEVKPAGERGSYLHPDVYGQPTRRKAQPIRTITPPEQ